LPACSRPYRGHLHGYGLKSYRCACSYLLSFHFYSFPLLTPCTFCVARRFHRCACFICFHFLFSLDLLHSIDHLSPAPVSVSRRIHLYMSVCPFFYLFPCALINVLSCLPRVSTLSRPWLSWCMGCTVIVYYGAGGRFGPDGEVRGVGKIIRVCGQWIRIIKGFTSRVASQHSTPIDKYMFMCAQLLALICCAFVLKYPM
jgi:hypothetical protein